MREGMFDDSGYHEFDECSRYKDCCKSAYEQGREDAIEEIYAIALNENYYTLIEFLQNNLIDKENNNE